MTAEPLAEALPYSVALDILPCSSLTLWSVVDPDGVALGIKFAFRKDAEDLAANMNYAAARARAEAIEECARERNAARDIIRCIFDPYGSGAGIDLADACSRYIASRKTQP